MAGLSNQAQRGKREPMTTKSKSPQPRPIASARTAQPKLGDQHEQAFSAYLANGKSRGEAFDLMLAYVARTRAAKCAANG